MKLSLQSFKDSYYYTNDAVNRIPELKSYLQGQRRDQSPLAVKVSSKINNRYLLKVCLSSLDIALFYLNHTGIGHIK